MESTKEQMDMIHAMCWKEIALLKMNLDKLVRDSERCQRLLNELISVEETTNTFGLIVFDRYMTQMVTALNMARKYNIHLEINNLDQTVVNASSNGCLDDTNFTQTRLLKDFIEWRKTCSQNDTAYDSEIRAVAGRIKMYEHSETNNKGNAFDYGNSRIKSLETSKNDYTKCEYTSAKTVDKLLNILLPTKSLSEFESGFEFDACIVHIQNYKELSFFICLNDDYKTLCDLSSNANFKKIPRELLPLDDLFCVLEKDCTIRECLLRAVIVPEKRLQSEKFAYLIDFGEVIPLTDNCITYIAPLHYKEIPPLAIKCILEGIEDSSFKCIRDPDKCKLALQKNEFEKVTFRIMYQKDKVLHVLMLETPRTNDRIYRLKNNKQTNPFKKCFEDDDENSSSNSDALQLPRSVIYRPLEANDPVLHTSFEIGDKIPVIVTHVVSPVSFYGIIQNDYCGDHKVFSWHDLQILPIQKQISVPPQLNDIILSQYAKDGYWYRAKVVNIDATTDLYEMNGYKKFEKFNFHWIDYAVFILMTVLSTGIGIYYGYFKKDKSVKGIQPEDDGGKTIFGSKKINEYLLGSRKLKIFPVAMSLVASYVSGVTILGTVSEIYNFGTQYWLILVSILFMAIAVVKVYIPVFMVLRVGSSYEYLERRFSPTIRSIASIMFVLDEIFFLPIILYIPAISLNQVTNINIHIISSTMCTICVIYTLIGGIKAVVHTDAWQIVVMFLSVLIVVILGIIYANGFTNVFTSASEGGRLIFDNINPSPYERQTVWAVLIGGFFYWTSFNSVNQTMVQRYMSLSSLKKAEWSVFLFTIGAMMFVSLCCFAGLLVYNFYKNCDPLTAGLITHDDQLLPLYVMQTVGSLHGIPGLFIAGVFGAALSSLSVVLNSTALVILEDITKGCFKLKMSEKAATILVKSSILVLGCGAVCLVFVLERLSGILSVAVSVTAIAAGTTCGLFTLGMLVPWSNTKGALAGAISGAVMTGWISFGSQLAYALGDIVAEKLPVSVRDCPDVNDLSTIALNNTLSPVNASDVFPLYRLSFHWINPIGVITTVLVGTIVSFLTGPTIVKKLDANVISPVIHRFLPKECFSSHRADGDVTRENADQTLTNLLNTNKETK